jgi:tetratricopeptide (TPR) repeat protein
LLLSPHSVAAQSYAAVYLAGRVLDQMTGSPAADIARAETLAAQALAAAPRSPLAHFAKGNVLRAQNRYAEAIPEYETVLAVDRNRVSAHAHIGQCKLVTGSIEDNSVPGASHPPQSLRSADRHLFWANWPGDTCWNRASTRRFSGLKRRAVPIRDYLTFVVGSPLPTALITKSTGPLPNSPKPAN